MFKRLITGAVALIISLGSFSQTENFVTGKPDFNEIERKTKDKNSPFFYQKLMDRYSGNDTSLTVEEYKYLYYGYSFSEKYSPSQRPDLYDELKKAVANKDDDKIIAEGKIIINHYPFNLWDLYMIDKTLEKQGKTAESKLYHKKMIGIAKAIMSTGDGTTDSTAMYVISVRNEYDMISLLGYKFGNSQSLLQNLHGNMDKLKLEKNEKNIEYLYFNVDRIFANYLKKD